MSYHANNALLISFLVGRNKETSNLVRRAYFVHSWHTATYDRVFKNIVAKIKLGYLVMWLWQDSM